MANGGDIEKRIISALEAVTEPTGKNLMEAGIVTEIRGEERTVVLTCRHPGWPDPIRQRIEREIQANVQSKLPQLESVSVQWQTTDDAPAATSSAGIGQQAPGQPPGADALDIKHVIAVGSGKGGVGKSTIAASLAYALEQRGLAVGLMDADVYGPSIPHLLGLSGQPEVRDNRYLPLQANGIKVISMGFLVPANQAVVWRGPMLHKAVRDFLHLVEWESLDYLIVDLPPGTGDVILSLSQQIPLTGGVIVCTPQDVALLDARKALSMFATVKIPCLGVVENMSFFECPKCGERTEIFGHGGAMAWAAEAKVPFLGHVPINLQIRLNGDEGNLSGNFAEDNPVREDLIRIADRMIENVESAGSTTVPELEIV